jgi:hypothetical protein
MNFLCPIPQQYIINGVKKESSPQFHVSRDKEKDKQNLQRLESEYMDSKFRDKSELLSLISDIKDDLYDLSKVQLKEGKRQMSLSEKTMDTIELFTQVEIIFLIVMAVLIQLIVLYQPKDKKQSQAPE